MHEHEHAQEKAPEAAAERAAATPQASAALALQRKIGNRAYRSASQKESSYFGF